MNDLGRLRLLQDLLNDPPLFTSGDLLKLAGGIESLLTAIDEAPEVLMQPFTVFWEALEVLGVRHLEANTVPTSSELTDLGMMADALRREVASEINRRVFS
jgi:hypothetical protein